MNGLAGCSVSTIGKPHEYFDLTGVRVDDEQAARPHGPRTSKGNPESPFRVVERWAWALFLQRRHLLPQSDVLQHQVGAAPTHRPNGTDAK